ncbi:MAG: DUF711 family protein [Chloroflexota bacterium]
MKIRTLTCFFDPKTDPFEHTLSHLASFAEQAARALQQAGFTLQTRRLATTPFPHWLNTSDPSEAIRIAQTWEQKAAAAGFAYLSLGCATPEFPAAYSCISPLLAATRNVFLTGLMTTSRYEVDLAAVRACAEAIVENAPLEENGFANLRFAALANVPAGCPFLPAAYHAPGQPLSFALGFECADTILQTFQTAHSLEEARQSLLSALEGAAHQINSILAPLQTQFGLHFYGFDFSTAPYPQDWCSVGAAMEQLGIERLGTHGSLAAAAFLAETLNRGKWKRAGFNGLMLPVLEDSRLALRSAQGSLSVKDLLLYSTVCGTGLDTVPLPGDCTPQAINALLLDLAALSLRLNKPLTARLMPMPGKRAGDEITFSFEFFSSGRVMTLEADKLGGLLAKEAVVELQAR